MSDEETTDENKTYIEPADKEADDLLVGKVLHKAHTTDDEG